MTPEQLIKASMDRRAITGFHASIESRMPAAFIVSMPFFLVMRAMPHLKIYTPKKTKRPKHHEH